MYWDHIGVKTGWCLCVYVCVPLRQKYRAVSRNLSKYSLTYFRGCSYEFNTFWSNDVVMVLFCKINDNTFSLYVSVYLEPFGKTTGPILMNIFRNSFRKMNDYDWSLSNLIKLWCHSGHIAERVVSLYDFLIFCRVIRQNYMTDISKTFQISIKMF